MRHRWALHHNSAFAPRNMVIKQGNRFRVLSHLECFTLLWNKWFVPIQFASSPWVVFTLFYREAGQSTRPRWTFLMPLRHCLKRAGCTLHCGTACGTTTTKWVRGWLSAARRWNTWSAFGQLNTESTSSRLSQLGCFAPIRMWMLHHICPNKLKAKGEIFPCFGEKTPQVWQQPWDITFLCGVTDQPEC